MRIVVHVGSPKTGSTSIQRSLSESREVLREMGYFYPSVGKRPDHTLLVPSRSTDPGRKWQLSEDAWAELEDSIRYAKPKNVILSSEYLYNRDLAALKIFNGRLRRISRDIKYAGYLRSPKPRYLSELQQWVKFTSTVLSPVTPPTYRVRVLRFRQIPEVQVAFKSYERERLLERDIVFDFLVEHAGLGTDLAGKIPTISENESVSAEGMVLLQHVNKVIIGSDRQSNFASKQLLNAIHAVEADGSFSRPQLRHNIKTLIDHINNADMVWLKREAGISFSDAMADDGFTAEPSYEFPLDAQMSDIIEFDSTKLAQLEDRVLVHLNSQTMDSPDRVDRGDEKAAIIDPIEQSLSPLRDDAVSAARTNPSTSQAQIAASLVELLARRSQNARRRKGRADEKPEDIRRKAARDAGPFAWVRRSLKRLGILRVPP